MYRYHKRRQMRRARGPLLVPAIGTHRRIEALRAIGWPTSVIAEKAGRAARPGSIIRADQEMVRAELHDRIRDVYDRLSMTPGPSDRVRVRAINAGCVPPLAWDDDQIDDPAARPFIRPAVPRWCSKGHRLAGDNAYRSVRRGRPRVQCRQCRLEQYAGHEVAS